MGKETPAILIKYFLIRHGWKFAVLGAIWGSFVLLVSVLLYSITEPYSIVNDVCEQFGCWSKWICPCLWYRIRNHGFALCPFSLDTHISYTQAWK